MAAQDDARFWDRFAARYAKSPVKNVPAYEATLADVRGRLAGDAEVLEIGCGTGTTALKLAPDLGHITGTDISAAMIEIAQGKMGGAANVTFRQAPAVDDIFAPESFDAVLAFSILHLTMDLDATLARVRTLLKPGGLFLSKTPCLGDMGAYLRLLIPVMRLVGFAPNVLHLTHTDLTARIESAGFEIVDSKTFEGAPNSRYIVARKPSA